jgi:predicted negative regulator of RcsB-dependent stress response
VSEKEAKKLSRRAERRAKKGADEEEAAPESGESEAEDDAAESEEETSDEEADEDEARPAPSAADSDEAKKPSKTERKRAKQAKSTEEIRDRNKRMREQAASGRKVKRERERGASARGLDTSEMVDDAFARGTHAIVTFTKRHFSAIQWVIVLGIAGGIGYQIWSWRSGKTNARASDLLMAAVNAELGQVGEEASSDPTELRPSFPTEQARLEAASKAYDSTIADKPGSGTAILAELGKAGVLFDMGKYPEAYEQYEKVKNSPLAKNDADVRMRATEGTGLSLEAKGDLDGAEKIFKVLEQSDEAGFSTLGMYHQARLLVQKGHKDKAIELLTKLNEKLSKEQRSPTTTASYVEKAARDLMGVIDPSKAPPTASNYTPDQVQALQQQILKDPKKLQQMLKEMGQMKAPNMPVPEAPPEGPEPSPEEPTPPPANSQ